MVHLTGCSRAQARLRQAGGRAGRAGGGGADGGAHTSLGAHTVPYRPAGSTEISQF
jgi:hypothetical protein